MFWSHRHANMIYSVGFPALSWYITHQRLYSSSRILTFQWTTTNQASGALWMLEAPGNFLLPRSCGCSSSSTILAYQRRRYSIDRWGCLERFFKEHHGSLLKSLHPWNESCVAEALQSDSWCVSKDWKKDRNGGQVQQGIKSSNSSYVQIVQSGLLIFPTISVHTVPVIEVTDKQFVQPLIRQHFLSQVTVPQQTPHLEIITLAPGSKPTIL